MRPFRLRIDPFLRDGANQLEVNVTNLLINSVLGSPEPDYSTVHAQFGQRFPNPLEWVSCHPLPSRLVGPVQLEIETP
jgi:hypothetical protein